MSTLDHVDAMNAVVPDGRAANAWRTGARARRVSVREEDTAEFEELCDALVAEWRPPNVTAWLLVDHLARLQWRLGRAGEAETCRLDGLQSAVHVAGHLAGSVASPVKTLACDVGSANSSLQRIQLYQMRLERAVHRCIGLLLTLRKSRGKLGGLSRNDGRRERPQAVAGRAVAGDTAETRAKNGAIKSDVVSASYGVMDEW